MSSSSSFGAVCLARAEDVATTTTQQAHFTASSTTYEPTPLVTFLSEYLPSLSLSRRSRQPPHDNNNNSNGTVIAVSPLIHDWMQGNDRTAYAISVLSTWIIVSIGMVLWLLLLWIVPRLSRRCRCCSRRTRRKRSLKLEYHDDDDDDDEESKKDPSLQKLPLKQPASQHFQSKGEGDIVSSNGGSLEIYSAGEYSEEKFDRSRSLGAALRQQHHQQCFVVDNDDMPMHNPLPPPPSSIPVQEHPNLQDVSELTGLSLNDDSSILPSPPLRDLNNVSSSPLGKDQSLTASQYLSYCNSRQTKSASASSAVPVPHLMEAASRDDSVSINLLESSDSSSSIDNKGSPAKSLKDKDITPDAKEGNTTQQTRTFEDVLRNVYLDDSADADIPFADESTPTDEEEESMIISFSKNLYAHLPLPPGLLPSTEPDLSTIAASLDTSFPPQIMEDGFLFFEDEDEGEENGGQKKGATQLLQHPYPTKQQSLLPPTSSLTIKANAAASNNSPGNSTEEISPNGSVLKHSQYASHAASRKRQLEQYVQSIKTTNSGEQGEAAAVQSTSQLEPWMAQLVRAAGGVVDDPAQLQVQPSGTQDTSPTSTGADTAFQDEEDRQNCDLNETQSVTAVANEQTQDEASGAKSPLRKKLSAATDGSWRMSRGHHQVNFATSPKQSSQSIDREASPRDGCCRDSRIPSIIVLVACTGMIVSAILFAMNGVWTIHLVAQDVGRSWDELVQMATQDTPDALQQLEEAQDSVLQQTWNVWQSLDSNCPKLHPKICSSSSKDFGQSSSHVIADFWKRNSTVNCDLEGLPLKMEWNDWATIAQPQSVLTMKEPQDSLLAAQDDATDFWVKADSTVDDYMAFWDWSLYVALAANICLALVGFGIMWCIAMSDGPPIQRFLNAPFCWCSSTVFSTSFWMLFLLAWAFGMWFSIQTVLTVDTCSTDASGAIPVELMNRFESKHPVSAPLMSQWRSALQECSTIGKVSRTEDSQPWDSLMRSTQRLSAALQSLPPNIYYDVCGVAVWPLQDATLKLQKELCDMQEAWEGAQWIEKECQQWTASYASLRNDSICNQGSTILLWLSVTQMLILVSAMVVWTFRRGTFL